MVVVRKRQGSALILPLPNYNIPSPPGAVHAARSLGAGGGVCFSCHGGQTPEAVFVFISVVREPCYYPVSDHRFSCGEFLWSVGLQMCRLTDHRFDALVRFAFYADIVEHFGVVVVAVGETEFSFDLDRLVSAEREDVCPAEAVGVVAA